MKSLVEHQRLNLVLFPILTGLLIGTSYIPFPPWAMLFGLAPLFVAFFKIATDENLSRLPTNRVFVVGFFMGWLAQLVLNLIGFHWIAITAIEFGHFPKWAGVLILLVFSSLAHTYYGFTGAIALVIFHKLKKRGIELSSTLFVGLTIALFLLIEALWPSIFPWHLGYTWLWAELPGAQFSDVIGFEGLNVITLFCNGLFAVGYLRWTKKEMSFGRRIRPTLPWLVSGLTLFLMINVLGLGREKKWQQPSETLDLLIVQGNIGNYEKLIVERQKDFSIPIIQTYLRLSAEGFNRFPHATYALWPETAFPDYLDSSFQNQSNWIALQQFAIASKRTILTGAYSYDPTKRETYNGFFAMNTDGQVTDPPYRKSILIPFGEKFPFSDVIPYMKWLFPGLGSFGQGPGPSVMNLGLFKLGPQICLESLYPEFSAAMARQGAEIFSNVTNDSWFGQTFEPYQHMTMTLARALENRRPLLRSTNTGISTVILADGTVLERSPLGKEWIGIYKVPFQKNPTITTYSRIAGFSPWFSGILVLLVLGISFWANRRRPPL